MINFTNVSLRIGTQILLRQVNWSIYPQQRIGLIGANGSGKTSLFNLLLGRIAPDEGDLFISKKLRFAHVSQEALATKQSALDFVLDGDQPLRSLQKELSLKEKSNDGYGIAHIHDQLLALDAYTATARAAQLLSGLGFSENEIVNPVSSFSGGWRIRLSLAQALMAPSDILLLDEPTNHLDLDALFWLEEWLKQYKGILLIISHDREFLDKTIQHIAHLSQQSLKMYTGNYSQFEQQLANELLIQQASYEKQQQQIKSIKSFVDRFRAKASKAKQAQSRLKALEKINLVCAVAAHHPFQFHFASPESCPNPLISLENIHLSFGQKRVLQAVHFSIMPGQRIALLGPNGAGKSSLMKILAGELKADQGQCIINKGLKIGYFAQHQLEQLNLSDSPLMHLNKLSNEEISPLELRSFLGKFGFSNERVLQPVEYFSGGEKARLALALIVWQRPNLLLLDEPTNHLDLEMRHALSIALQTYEGAMILVSHDRFLIRSTTDQCIILVDGHIQSFDGDLHDFQQWLFDYRKKNNPIALSNQAVQLKKEKREQERRTNIESRDLMRKIKNLEHQLDQSAKELQAIESNLADCSFYEPEKKDELKNLLSNQIIIKSKLKNLENAWFLACEEHDKLLEIAATAIEK